MEHSPSVTWSGWESPPPDGLGRADTSNAALLQADLRAFATRAMLAEQRLAEARFFSRRAREREMRSARADAAARGIIALPDVGAAAADWQKWVADSVEARTAWRQQSEEAAEVRGRAQAAVDARLVSEAEAETASRSEVQDLKASTVNEPGSDTGEMYHPEDDRATGEHHKRSALAEAIGELSIATAAGTVLVGGVAVGAGAALAAGAAVFGPSGTQALSEVMGSPLEGLGARVDALLAGPVEGGSLRPLDVVAPVRALTT